MKYIIVITSWMLCCSLSNCQTMECSSSGEVVVMSDNLAQIVIPDQSIVQPYKPEITLPNVCNIDRTCSMLVFEVEIVRRKLLEKHLWVPNNGPMNYFTINVNESSVTYGPTLHGNDCFKFFLIDSHHIGALCTGRLYDENLIIPYIVEYNEQGEPHSNRLSGVEIHLDIENHSPFIVLNNTGMLKAVGISYFEHLSVYKLIIIHYTAGGRDAIDVPPDCPGGHDLQPVNQSDAIIRCANGKVLYFNGFHSTFTTLTYSNIEIISTCPNTMSYVLVQGTDNIIFNKSGVMYHLSVNASVRPLTIASAVCYATGEDDITFYYVDTTSDKIYNLYLGGIITLGSREGIVPQIVRSDITSDGEMITLYNDGSILWDKLAISNDSDVSVQLTNVLTEKQSSKITVKGPNVFVQLYTAEKCKDDITVKPIDDVLQQDSNNQTIAGLPQHIAILLGVVIGIILLIIILIGVAVYMRRRRKASQHMYIHTVNRESGSLEMEPMGSTQSDDRSQTPGLTDNSTSPLIERYETVGTNDQQLPAPTTHDDDHSTDTTPVQTKDRQLGELVSPTDKIVTGSQKHKTTTPNAGHSSIDDVD